MRWSVAGPGYAVADGFGLKAGGLVRYSLITVVAFGLSGTVHMGLVPPQPLHATVSANAIRLYVAGFFWAQPMAMLVETLGAKIMKSVTGLSFWQGGAGRLARLLVNGVWVLIWFTLTMPLLSEAGKQMGYWRVWTVPISIWQGLKGEGWIAWPV